MLDRLVESPPQGDSSTKIATTEFVASTLSLERRTLVADRTGGSVNGTSEQTLITHTIPANTLSAGGDLRLEADGAFTASASQTITLRIKINGTTVKTVSRTVASSSAWKLSYSIRLLVDSFFEFYSYEADSKPLMESIGGDSAIPSIDIFSSNTISITAQSSSTDGTICNVAYITQAG